MLFVVSCLIIRSALISTVVYDSSEALIKYLCNFQSECNHHFPSTGIIYGYTGIPTCIPTGFCSVFVTFLFLHAVGFMLLLCMQCEKWQ